MVPAFLETGLTEKRPVSVYMQAVFRRRNKLKVLFPNSAASNCKLLIKIQDQKFSHAAMDDQIKTLCNGITLRPPLNQNAFNVR